MNNQNESHTTDHRGAPKAQKIMTNTWMPNNKNLTDQFKNFTMMNQYKAMGLNNEMQKLLSETLSSYNGRNYLNKSRKSSKKNSRRGHSATRSRHSKKRKSPSRGRNDPNHIFLNLMKQSLRGSKSRSKRNYSATNEGYHKGSSKRSRSRRSRANNTPKRGIEYKNMFVHKGGSTRVSRKHSAANSNERGAYSTYIGSRVSPKSKKKKASMDYDFTNTNSFTNMMSNMRVSFQIKFSPEVDINPDKEVLAPRNHP